MYFNETLYDFIMFPFEAVRLKKLRSLLLKRTYGNVLEIGVGSGANLKYYPYSRIKHLALTDIDVSKTIKEYPFPKDLKLTIKKADVESLPFEDNSFDFVVFTLVFCSVEDPLKGLAEIKRVLKPNGKIIFIEHVLPSNLKLQKIFHKLSPTWEKIACNCHLDRETLKQIEEAGFQIEAKKHYLQDIFLSGIASVKE